MADSFVGILGAGTMGAGIAQVAAAAAWTVYLSDKKRDVVDASIAGIHQRFDRLVEKQQMSQSDCEAAKARVIASPRAKEFKECSLLIEAIIEDFDVKLKALFPILDIVDADCIVASNTSSLSIAELGDALGIAPRFVGMHFFNPAPIMKLVEVIAGKKSDPGIVNNVAQIAESWGKVVARAADVPGFIVNHVARPYYLEAFRILEDGFADAWRIDHAMRTIGGFRMGPLELTDLIGQDINTATTRSVWEQLGKPPLLQPSKFQEQLVRDGRLGKKTGLGVYDYAEPLPSVALKTDHRDIKWNDTLRRAVSGFVEGVSDAATDHAEQYIFGRVVSALIVQAHRAWERGVAKADDIDTALKFGVNYPKGPFEWTRLIGAENVIALLDVLNQSVDDNRFQPPKSLVQSPYRSEQN